MHILTRSFEYTYEVRNLKKAKILFHGEKPFIGRLKWQIIGMKKKNKTKKKKKKKKEKKKRKKKTKKNNNKKQKKKKTKQKKPKKNNNNKKKNKKKTKKKTTKKQKTKQKTRDCHVVTSGIGLEINHTIINRRTKTWTHWSSYRHR